MIIPVQLGKIDDDKSFTTYLNMIWNDDAINTVDEISRDDAYSSENHAVELQHLNSGYRIERYWPMAGN